MDNSIRPIDDGKRCKGANAVKSAHSFRKWLSNSTALTGRAGGLVASLILTTAPNAYALPTAGVVSAGNATITSAPNNVTINQSSQNAAINWQTFGIAQNENVQFVQPNSNSVALNRVLGPDPSEILGSLSANGKVFLVNPNGVLFGQGAQVNVGGMVASTLNITDANFMSGNYQFSGISPNAVVNQGTIHAADGGYVALLGANVSNLGTITAKLGTVALAGGTEITLDVAGDGLLNIAVNQGAMNALIQNGGLIQANGGQVVMTAQAAGNLLSAVNNTGVIEAQTVDNINGTIKLLGDMQSGTVNVAGTLDASAPNGGDGGSIETSATHVEVAANTVVTTQSMHGVTGTWLIDPADYNIGSAPGETSDMSGATLTQNW